MSSSPTPDHLVRTHLRRRRYTALVWSLALAFLATALHLATRLSWLPASAPFIIGHWALVISSALGLTTWFFRARRLDPASVARDLDAAWQLQSRIEAAAELADNPSSFAAAQRSETAARLADRPRPRATAWRSGLVALASAFLFLLAASIVSINRILTSAALPPPLPPDISASIEWRTPASEIKATAIDEIALAASADTRTGFRSVTLEVSVNGEPRASLPLEPDAFAPLAKPGVHPVALPLYLDEIAPAEFDIVSYHLRADRATAQPAPPVTSPLQFIQIRPARDDVRKDKSGGKSGQCANLIAALKIAQLSLLKQNFLLAHAPIAKTDAAWTEANTSVSSEQALLATKADEVRTFAINEQLHPLIVDNLAQVIPLMTEASQLIADTRNEPAARPQGRSLALITEIEKILRKVLRESADPSAAALPPPPRDPFKDDQRFKLPPRPSTPAGQLEQLAQEQSEAAKKTSPPPAGPPPGAPSASPASAPGTPPSDTGRDLARAPSSPTAPSPGSPSAAAQQAALAQRAADLAKNERLSPEAQRAAEQAARDAAAAAAQLKQNDPAAARAPALAAADTLRSAAEAQDKAGRASARAELETTRRALNEAAANPDDAARSAALADLAEQLREAARAQQESGSAEAARHLAAAATEIAKAASASDVGRELARAPNASGTASGPSASPPGNASNTPSASPADAASQAAARAQAALTDRPDAIARATRQLQRGAGSANGAGTASDPSAASSPSASPGSSPTSGAPSSAPGSSAPSSTPPPSASSSTDLLLGAQLAHAILNTPESARLSGAITLSTQRGGSYNATVMTPDVRAAADNLRVLLAAALAENRRDETIRRFNPEDLDPAYREAIETYFERLSREATSSR